VKTPLSVRTSQIGAINRWVEDGSWETGSGSVLVATTPMAAEERHSLILMALVDLATSGAAWESTKERRDMLADAICQSLVAVNLLPPAYTTDALRGLRSSYYQPMLDLVEAAKERMPRQGLPALMGPEQALVNSSVQRSIAWRYKSRYATEFVEGALLGTGGFGAVYMATNRLDRVTYAVKKIHIILSSHVLLLKILREASLLAKISHPHIVSYKTAWTEPCSSGGVVEVDGSTCSGSGDLEDWEDGAVIEEVDDADEWSAEGASRVSGKYEGRFWQQSYGGEEQHQQETNGEVSVVFSNGNTYSKSSFKFNNNVGNLGSKKSSSSSFGRADQAGRQQLATRRTQGAHSCILFIQMELCSSTLRQWLDERNQSSDGVEARPSFHIFRQLLLATAYLHNQGIIHRDIKPRNVFVNSRQEVKLGDFGLAKEMIVSSPTASPNTPSEIIAKATFPPYGSTQDTSGVGTSAYAAPEQLCKGGSVDEKTDIYSLGIVLWELYTQTRTEMERVEGISSLRRGMPEVRQPMEAVQAGLGELVRLLTSNDPEDRPTAASMLEQQFSEKDLDLLDSGREAKALRDQVALQAKQIAAQGNLICEQERELAVLRALLARREDKNKKT